MTYSGSSTPAPQTPPATEKVEFFLRVHQAVKTYPWEGVVPYEGSWPTYGIPGGDIVALRNRATSPFDLWVIKPGITWDEAFADVTNSTVVVKPGEAVPNIAAYQPYLRHIGLGALLYDRTGGRTPLPETVSLELEI